MIIKLLNNNNTIWKPFVNPHFQSKAGRKLKELQTVPFSAALNKDCITKMLRPCLGRSILKCASIFSAASSAQVFYGVDHGVGGGGVGGGVQGVGEVELGDGFADGIEPGIHCDQAHVGVSRGLG